MSLVICIYARGYGFGMTTFPPLTCACYKKQVLGRKGGVYNLLYPLLGENVRHQMCLS